MTAPTTGLPSGPFTRPSTAVVWEKAGSERRSDAKQARASVFNRKDIQAYLDLLENKPGTFSILHKEKRAHHRGREPSIHRPFRTPPGLCYLVYAQRGRAD